MGAEKKKKVLFVATVDSVVEWFLLPYLKMFRDNGYEVHVATNSKKPIQYCDKKIRLPITRSPFTFSNLKAISELKKKIKKESYDIIHCHTPMGGVVTRLAAKGARKNGTRVIYTAHGFHFYKGAPLHYWLMFYPVEKYLAKYTDTLITINTEDYERAKKKFGKRCRDIQYVLGVGVDERRFKKKISDKEKSELRKTLGLNDDDKVLICIGRLDKNKNQGFLIKAMPELIKNNSRYHLLLVGPDELDGKYQRLVNKLNICNNVHFLGFSNGINELLQISDIAVSASKREGLPLNLIEVAFFGLPIVATDCRGNRDVCNLASGNLFVQGDWKKFVENIEEVVETKKGSKKISEFSLDNIMEIMQTIYNRKERVLHLLASNKFSGAENVACTIIRNMSDNFEMAYCSPKGSIEDALREQGIKYIEMDKLNYVNVKKVVKSFNPDIIHAHDFRASILSAGFSKYAKIVSHIHQNSPRAQKKTVAALMYLLATLRMEKIVWVSNDACDGYAFKAKVISKSVVLQNVIDSNYVKNMSKVYDVDKSYDVIFLGRLVEEKDPERALKILNIVKEQKKNISMAMVGDGGKRDAILQIIKQQGLSSNVDFYGFQENPYPILEKSKIMLLTSRREGVPMSVLEAQSMGKPVISTDVGGLKKIVFNGKNGFLSDDDEELASDILETLDDIEYANISKNVCIIFEKNNFFERYFEQMYNIYSFALDGVARKVDCRYEK